MQIARRLLFFLAEEVKLPKPQKLVKVSEEKRKLGFEKKNYFCKSRTFEILRKKAVTEVQILVGASNISVKHNISYY